MKYDEKIFQSPEAAISYIEDPPNGSPVVLLHGVASRWQSFQPILSGLSERHQVFAPDLRGHGRSGHTPGAYRLDDYTRDIQQFLEEQVRRPVVVYGHSLGGLVAINLAARHPLNMRGLILGDPPLFYHDTAIQDTFWLKAFTDLLELKIAHPDPAEMGNWLEQNFPNMPPARREERVRSLEWFDPDVLRAIISDAFIKGISLPELLPRVTCPVLLLRGNSRLGSALREQDVHFAVTHFPNIQVLAMETVGHGLLPDALLPNAMEFIDAAMGSD